MTFEPSPARKGLDALLALHPGFDVLAVEWQGRPSTPEPFPPFAPSTPGPWLCVDLGQASEGEVEAFAVWRFAILKTTGAVYGIGHDGAVADDPLLEVA